VVYNMAMRSLRSSPLPVQYLFFHNRLADPGMFLHASFWTAPRYINPPHAGRRVCCYAFLAFVLTLCIITNLMGPAVAVLLLPTKGRAAIGGQASYRFEPKLG